MKADWIILEFGWPVTRPTYFAFTLPKVHNGADAFGEAGTRHAEVYIRAKLRESIQHIAFLIQASAHRQTSLPASVSQLLQTQR